MPGELERLIINLLQPKPTTSAKAAAALILEYDQIERVIEPDTATCVLSPSNLWDTARWSECVWG